jgi:hypothetical protein
MKKASKHRMVVKVLTAMVIGYVGLVSVAWSKADRMDPQLWKALQHGETQDLVVEFKQKADLSDAYAMAWVERGRYVWERLKETARKSQVAAIAILMKQGIEHRSFIAGNELYVKMGNLQAVAELAQLPEVAFIRVPIVIELEPVLGFSPPQHPEAGTVDWGITDTGADQFWHEIGCEGAGIVVANIDTGVQWDHPALRNQYRCKETPGDNRCWEDPSHICGPKGSEPCDNHGHGTHTMGTIAASNDPIFTYIAGMAPEAQWIACKGCEDNSCSDYALNACADWILAPGGNPDHRPHVVNNSWGGFGGDDWYMDKVNVWLAAGIFPAFSAGNSGSSCQTLGSPGDYPQSFASANHDNTRTAAVSSSRGPSVYGHTPYTKPNISAPGTRICSTVPENAWSCGYSGTSMASPHVAGSVALLWSCNPDFIGDTVATAEVLQETADVPPEGNCGAPPDGEGNYTYGYGYLNVLAAGRSICEPQPVLVDIKANGSDSPIQISPFSPVAVRISVEPGAKEGESVEWWVAVQTPFDPPYGWYSWIYPTGWTPGIHEAAQTPLFRLTAFEVWNATLPPGLYTFFVALDDQINDQPDCMWLDSVTVEVQ